MIKILSDRKSDAWLIIFLSWLMYTTSYLGKVNYSANITQIIDFYGITKAEAGIVPSFFFFAYGIGQVVNGILCKKYNIKWMIFSSLMTSAVINLVIAVTTDFGIVKWLWMINGFALSVLWPTLVRLLSEVLPKKDLSRSSVVMGTTVAVGTLVIYALSSVYAMFNQFKFAFYTAAFAGCIVSVIWLTVYNKAVKMSKTEQSYEITDQVKAKEQVREEHENESHKIFYISIAVFCFCAVGVNLVKDGLTTWVPSILKDEYGMQDSLSILLTLLLPIIAIFGNVFALRMHEKIPDYITHCFLGFVAIGVFIGIIIGSLSLKLVIPMLIGLVIVNFLASSLNSLITSIYPIFMRGKVNSGLFAGILNGFCYLGSTISSYGLGAVADYFGWTSVFFVLAGFCAAVGLIWCIYVCITIFIKKMSNI